MLTGNYSFGVCSGWVQGDTIRVLLYSDSSVQGNGFTVSSVNALMAPELKARFPGQWYDKDTQVNDANGDMVYAGLHYNWHRFYDPNVGRYITPDPIGLAGGMNPYSYAGSDPTNYADPMGLFRRSDQTLSGQIALREALNQHGRTAWRLARKVAAAKRLARLNASIDESSKGVDSPSKTQRESIQTDLTLGPISPEECTDEYEPDLDDDDRYIYFYHGVSSAHVPSLLRPTVEKKLSKEVSSWSGRQGGWPPRERRSHISDMATTNNEACRFNCHLDERIFFHRRPNFYSANINQHP